MHGVSSLVRGWFFVLAHFKKDVVLRREPRRPGSLFMMYWKIDEHDKRRANKHVLKIQHTHYGYCLHSARSSQFKVPMGFGLIFLRRTSVMPHCRQDQQCNQTATETSAEWKALVGWLFEHLSACRRLKRVEKGIKAYLPTTARRCCERKTLHCCCKYRIK